MSECLETAPPTAVASRSSEARAARLAKFERERLIVDTLNRGVSVAEIAARFDVGEKRMRAIIRDPRTWIP
jgi:transposase